MEALLLQAGPGPGFQMASIMGHIGVIALATYGAIRCETAARRPEVNALAARSLALFFVSWTVAVIGGWVRSTLAGKPEAAGLDQALRWMLVAVILSLIIGSMVLAMTGMVQMRRHRGRWKKGLPSAIWAISLSTLFGAFAIVPPIMATVREAVSSVPTAALPQQPLVFEKFNFELVGLGPSWARMDISAVNPVATVCLRHKKRDVYVMAIAETVNPDNSVLTTEVMAELTAANVKVGSRDARVSETRPMTAGGIKGLAFDSMATVEGHPLAYCHWVAVRNGFAYQLVAYGKRTSADAVRSALAEASGAFHQLDPHRRSEGSGLADRKSMRGNDVGVEWPLEEGGWLEWKDINDLYPAAVDGVLAGDGSGLMLVSLPLPSDVAVDDYELLPALLRKVDLDYDSGIARPLGPVDQHGLKAVRFEAIEDRENVQYVNRIRFVRTRHWAHVLMGWTTKEHGDGIPLIERVLAAARIDGEVKGELPSRLKPSVADALNEVGLKAYERQRYDVAAAFFAESLAMVPELATYALNRFLALANAGKGDEAIAEAIDHLERWPDHHGVRADMAENLMVAERLDEAVDQYERAFAAGYRDAPQLLKYADLLIRVGQPRRCLEVLARYAGDDHSTAATLRRSQALRDQGDHDGALAVLDKALALLPDEPTLQTERVGVLVDADRFEEAVAEATSLVDRGQGSADVWFERGRAEMGLERYAEARDSFERAQTLRPDESVQLWLDSASSMVGRGDDTLARAPIDPVVLPEALEARFADVADMKPPAGASAFHRRSTRVTQYAPGRPVRRTHEDRVVMLNRAALEAYGTLSFDFDAQSERIYLNSLEVVDDHGQVVATLDRDQVYVIDAAQEGVHDDDKRLVVPVPGLAIGRELRYAVTWEDRTDEPRLRLTRRRLALANPSAIAMIALVGQPSLVRSVATGPQMTRLEGDGSIAWEARNLPGLVGEAYAADIDDIAPGVWLSDTKSTWDEVARGYLERLQDHLGPPPEAIAGRLSHVPANATPGEVLAHVARVLRETLTYEAVAFGVRGVIPHRPEEILHQRFGDCKDHALLAWHLLRSRGIEAHLALLRTEGPITRELPSLDAFDHMVVVVPGVGPNVVFDATDPTNDPLAIPPYSVLDRDLLILDPDHPRFMRVEAPAPDRCVIDSKRRVRWLGDDRLRVEEKLTADGYPAEWLRAMFLDEPADRRVASVQSYLESFGVSGVERVKVSGLDDPRDPVTLELDYIAEDAADAVGGIVSIRVPAVWERALLVPKAEPHRRLPWRASYGLRFLSEVTIAPPAATRFAPGERKDGDPEPVTASNGDVSFRWAAERQAGSGPPETYAAFVAGAHESVRRLRGPWRFEPVDRARSTEQADGSHDREPADR